MLTIPTSAGEVILKQPSGAGEIYHIMIGKLYHGQIVKVQAVEFDRERSNLDEVRQGGTVWHCYVNEKSELTKEDEKLLLEAIENTKSLIP